MGWQDRPYFRDRSGSSTNPLLWLLGGSIPMFTVFGIRVRAHASILLFVALTLALDTRTGYPISLRAFSMAMLVLAVILHEFGHCFMARWLGGSAHEILVWPLGGLASTDPPHRPRSEFLTAAAGPAVNLVLCILCGVGLYYSTFPHVSVPHNPFDLIPTFVWKWSNPAIYFWWFFSMNYMILLFNLLPIYPLDGGQMVQAMAWPVVGHYRSMMLATSTGMAGSLFVGVASLALHLWFLALFGAWLFYECYQRRMMLRETGPEEWREGGGVDYHASIYATEDHPPRRRRLSRRAINRARRIARQETAERNRIDTILAKVSAHGMQSLTWRERRALRKTTERQRRREQELSHFQ